jgi:hypothetical protein
LDSSNEMNHTSSTFFKIALNLVVRASRFFASKEWPVFGSVTGAIESGCIWLRVMKMPSVRCSARKSNFGSKGGIKILCRALKDCLESLWKG